MGQIQNIEDLLNFLRRRFWLVAVLVTLGVVISAVYAKTRPDTYQAYAVIEVQGPQIGGPGEGSSAQLLQSIEQRLTTRENLLAVIDRHGLYTDLPGLTEDERAALLRASITFEGIAAVGNNPYGGAVQLSAIVISASDGRADLAARVANDIAQGVLDMSASGQLQQARDALAFYQEEERRLSAQIAAVEAEVADYRVTTGAAGSGLPEAQRDELAALDTDLRALDQELVALLEEQRQLTERGTLRATEQRRLQDIDAQMAVLTEQKSALAARRAELDAALARLPEVERALAGYQRQLDQLQDSLGLVTVKLTEADTAAKLAERQQGERFALLDRAMTPEYPVGSGGKKLFMAGAMVSLLGALGLAFVLDLMKPVVRTSTQMERQLGIRPIVAIPELDLPGMARHGGGPRLGDMREKIQALPPMVLVCLALTGVLLVTAALV
jgi:tyrosine-protein kinase Etk/Wzc